MSKIVLSYFDGAGRGQAIRLAFKIGGIEFEDRRYKLGDASYKEYSPSGSLPVLEVNGKKYVESLAILMYAGRLAGLVPSSPEEVMKVRQIIHYPEDLWNSIGPVLFAPDDATRNSARKSCEQQFTKYFTNLEKIVKETFRDGHCVGGKLSVADLSVYCWYEIAAGNSYGLNVPNADKYTTLKAVHDTVKKHPKFEPFTPQFA